MVKMSIFPEFSNSLSPADFDAALDELELTYGVLSERLNVDTKTIGRWSRGESPVPGSVAILLRAAVAVQVLSHRWPGPEVAAPPSRRRRPR